MKLGIKLSGKVKGTISGKVFGIDITQSKEVIIKEQWIITKPKVPPTDPPLKTYQVENAGLLPEGCHIGGGSSKIKLFANFTGKAEVYEL